MTDASITKGDLRRAADYACNKGRETHRLAVKRLIRALPAGPAARLLNDIKILLRGIRND